MGAVAAAIGWRGFVAIGLALALLASHLSDKHHIHQRDTAIQAAANERAAHALTKTSLALLESRLAEYVRDGEKRQEEAARSLLEQRKRSAALGSDIARIRAERASTGTTGAYQCASPSAVLRAEGL